MKSDRCDSLIATAAAFSKIGNYKRTSSNISKTSAGVSSAVSKHEKTDESTRPQAEFSYCFRVFGNPDEARVFEITSPTKEN